jgi:hypothetical protein
MKQRWFVFLPAFAAVWVARNWQFTLGVIFCGLACWAASFTPPADSLWLPAGVAFWYGVKPYLTRERTFR